MAICRLDIGMVFQEVYRYRRGFNKGRLPEFWAGSMDLVVVDVSGIDCKVGDRAVL